MFVIFIFQFRVSLSQCCVVHEYYVIYWFIILFVVYSRKEKKKKKVKKLLMIILYLLFLYIRRWSKFGINNVNQFIFLLLNVSWFLFFWRWSGMEVVTEFKWWTKFFLYFSWNNFIVYRSVEESKFVLSTTYFVRYIIKTRAR